MHKQQRMLNTADIIIGTPGRLWEVISSTAGILKWLRQIKFLVVDEADRLLSQGNFKEVEEIMNSLDREDVDENASVDDSDSPSSRSERQTLVFSATFQKDLQRKLAGKVRPGSNPDGILSAQQSMDYLLKKLTFRSSEKPKFIDVNPSSQMATKLREGLVECGALEKDLYLYALLLHHPRTRILIFTNSIAAVRRLAPLLQNLHLPAHALHSQMPQKARLRSLERFGAADTEGQILVATDVASRGLDIPDVQLVLHYHAPRAASDYVHRSGRTARAGADGVSIMLCAPDEVVPVRRLVAKIHARKESKSGVDGAASGQGLRTLDLDRRLISRLKARVTLAKKIADAVLAKEKTNTEDNWLKTAAEELGVEYNEEEFVANAGQGGKGRGGGRVKKMRAEAETGKDEIRAWRVELDGELKKRVNTGVSERYLTSGSVDIAALLEGEAGAFLGAARGVGMD